MSSMLDVAPPDWASYWRPGVVLDPWSVFDRGFYLRRHEDVRRAMTDPWVHFDRFGRAEGRQPVEWFEPGWYAHRYGALPGVTDDAFGHFCAHGNLWGLAPNAKAEEGLITAAAPLFDVAYYLEHNADVSTASVPPWQHFLNEGWRELRKPSAAFDPAWYRDTHMGEAAGRANPLLHYVLIGRAQGLPTAPPARPGRGATASPAQPKTPETADKSIKALLALAEARGPAPEAALPEEDAALLARSEWFDSAHYAAQSGLAGADRAALVAHYLSKGWQEGHDPSPRFGGAFYATHYRRLPAGAALPACPEDSAPLVHFLRHGQTAGLYPNAQIAALEIEAIRASGQLDPEPYIDALSRRLIEFDPVADYAYYGHLEGVEPNLGFDGAFVRRLYSGLGMGAVHAPLAFVLNHLDLAWVFDSPAQLRYEAEQIRACPLFDEGFYIHTNGLEGSGVDPAEHYAVLGVHDALPTGPEFDTEVYLAANPDIALARINPLLHYFQHGRGEGRIGVAKFVSTPGLAKREIDPDKPTVLLFSHEASRTGAPIVALNVARRMAERWNVVVWLGKPDGDLREAFGEAAARIYEGWGAPSAMRRELEALKARYGADFALVNSVVCNPVIAPLRMAGIPIVSLIHEFADYVYPVGTLSRMAMFSEIAVFPARIVQEACEAELAGMGAAQTPAGLRVRPQGHNQARAGEADLSADQIRATLGLDPARTDQRVLFGAGQVQPRKGVDLFLQAAHQLDAAGAFDWRFVWVGGGYDPETDKTVSVYLQHQIRKSGLRRKVFMFGEQKNLDPFWDVADVFFMSSRLDPFPNVALDAMERAVPVVCFDGGTGVAELEPRFPFAVRAVTFADTAAAARAIEDFAARMDETAALFAGEAGAGLMQALSFEAYVEDLEGLGQEAMARSDARRAILKRLQAAPEEEILGQAARVPLDFRAGFLRGPRLARETLAEHLHQGCYRTGAALDAGADCLAGDPPGQPVVDARWGRAPGPALPSGHVVHLHVQDAALAGALFEPQGWPAALLGHGRLVITVPDEKTRAAVAPLLPERAELEAQAIGDSLEALAHVAARTAPEGDPASIGAATITHCDLALRVLLPGERPLPQRHVMDVLAGLQSAASLDCLAARKDVAAVVAALRREDASALVRDAFGLGAPEGQALPPFHAPGFAGTYRRADLGAFLKVAPERMQRASPGLERGEQTALAALFFAAFTLHEQGRGLLPLLTVTA